jgi:hypothetical protein
MTTIKSKALKALKVEKEKVLTQPVTVPTGRALGALFWDGTITTHELSQAIDRLVKITERQTPVRDCPRFDHRSVNTINL